MGNEKLLKLVNPHALNAILEAGEARVLVASEDIYDERGTKLWARDRQISRELRQRLLERKLRQPLESSLKFADGLDSRELLSSLESFLASDHEVAKLVQPWSRLLTDQVAHLPLQPVAQLLMTTMVEARPSVYQHAVRGMALAGAMSARASEGTDDLRLSMMGGLLHDLGEMYVDPSYLDGSKPLDIPMYRHVVAHPRVAEVLLAGLTKYPPSLSRAVGEHHERLDGSGYPSQRTSDQLSPKGRMLAVVETILGIMTTQDTSVERAGFALRVVPGEFDGAWAGFVTSRSEHIQSEAAPFPDGERADLCQRVRLLDTSMVLARETAVRLGGEHRADWIQRATLRAVARLDRIRAAWNALGLWAVTVDDRSGLVSAELGMAHRELRFRLSALRRECLWPELDLSLDDAALLAPLWDALSVQN